MGKKVLISVLFRARNETEDWIWRRRVSGKSSKGQQLAYLYPRPPVVFTENTSPDTEGWDTGMSCGRNV